jgi:hypothetical protein
MTITGFAALGGPTLYAGPFAPGANILFVRDRKTGQASLQGTLAPGNLDPILAAALDLPLPMTTSGANNALFIKIQNEDPFTGTVTENDVFLLPRPACTGAIGDVVWHDLDHDGTQGAGEPGIDGVRVYLRDHAGQTMQTVTTGVDGDQHGQYRFTGLCAGVYTVDVDEATLPSGFAPTFAGQGPADTDSNIEPAIVTFPSDQGANQTIDFGYFSPAAGHVGDFVWHDLDRDGIRDDGEPGINGVTVRLDAGNGNVHTTITAMSGGENGYYQFTGYPAGTYTITVDLATLPPGLQPTASYAGTADDDSNGSPATVTLGIDESNQTIDFGYVTPCGGTIGDAVWHDRNQNGIQDAGEPGLDGVTVRLKNAGGDLIGSTTTLVENGQHGSYQFTGLCAGAYAVEVDQATVPAGFSPALANAPGSTTENDSNGSPTLVVLAADDSTDSTIDFAYIAACTGTIGDVVWRDLDGNGIQDAGEPGIAGATVYLRNPADNTQLALTLTDGSGGYEFTGLCPGAYRVEVVTPAALSPTISQAGGGTPATDSNGSPALVTLPWEDSSDQSIDFGFVSTCTGRIGDFVWHDLDKDGRQDAGEPGIPGVVVRLKRGGVVIATTFTSSAGSYEFTGLCGDNRHCNGGDDYKVEAVTPEGYVPTTPTAWGTSAVNDSNRSPAFVHLDGNHDADPTIDFGFRTESHDYCDVKSHKEHDQHWDGDHDKTWDHGNDKSWDKNHDKSHDEDDSRHSDKGSNRDSDKKGSDKNHGKGNGKDDGKHAGKDSNKGSDKKDDDRNDDKTHGKDDDKHSGRDSDRNSGKKGSDKGYGKDDGKHSPRDSGKGADKKGSHKDYGKDDGKHSGKGAEKSSGGKSNGAKRK